jgi:uncharacterized protein
MPMIAEKFIVPLTGSKNIDEFFAKSSTTAIIKDVKVPTLFINSRDDPLIEFDFDKSGFERNPNVLLASTEHGGHVGSQENLIMHDMWHIKPAKAFFLSFIE